MSLKRFFLNYLDKWNVVSRLMDLEMYSSAAMDWGKTWTYYWTIQKYLLLVPILLILNTDRSANRPSVREVVGYSEKSHNAIYFYTYRLPIKELCRLNSARVSPLNWKKSLGNLAGTSTINVPFWAYNHKIINSNSLLALTRAQGYKFIFRPGHDC